jgi:hypothetical protein
MCREYCIMSRSVSVFLLTMLMSVSMIIFELSVQYCIVHIAGKSILVDICTEYYVVNFSVLIFLFTVLLNVLFSVTAMNIII